MSRRRPFFQEPEHAVIAGVVMFGLGWACFWDAWDGRGADQPRWFRPFSWW
jgi:hypothetical protein